MNYILDTHTFLWWIGDDERLSKQVFDIVADKNNKIYFSAVSAWEISIKIRIGKLTVAEDPDKFLTDNINENGFLVMPINLIHSTKIFHIPNTHRNPFDQMLAAQSLSEKMPLLSEDSKIAELGAELIW
ncbi:MAG: type II toxin-antitoxin system VapC family toxin [Spirochaetales bacterium]|nr:type II toxin-antitoxin system VapC family toxin [Spirochaetales bacterium]